MSQFTLYENENKNSKKAYPYFVDVQNDLLDELNSRVVIPLSLYEVTEQNECKKVMSDNRDKKKCAVYYLLSK